MQRVSLQEKKKSGGRGFFFIFALGILSFLIMLLGHVWTNIEKVDTSYFITRTQSEITEKRDHLAKLEVELERMLTPHELLQKAQVLGMHEPAPGQIRSIGK
ncbi:MAG: hypothetical protein IJU40_00735 [Desulfovibrionaceae bacterium]|nr:hypothetical protein [Desulfovibrionaceae bacterium]